MPEGPAATLSARIFAPDHVLFPEITYKSFIYPGDEEALAALKNVPGAGPLLTYLQENFTEQLVFVKNNEQMIRASSTSFGSLQKLVQRCSEILSCPVPDLYITTSPTLNAYTVGQRRTCIVLHSAIVEALTADELCFVIGHEIGHIKCAHGLYRQLGDLLVRYWEAICSLIPVPGLGLLRVPLLIAFWEWYRRAEFTCDRAGLLCVQDVEPAQTALGKLAGHVTGFHEEFSIEEAIAQSEAHKEVNKLVLVVSILENMQNTHPFVPARLRQLRGYADSDQYRAILSGKYERDPLGLHEGGARVQCACGTKVNAKLKFCPGCGRPVQVETPALDTELPSCESCHGSIAPGIRFCPHCGAKQESVKTPTSVADRLRNAAAGFRQS